MSVDWAGVEVDALPRPTIRIPYTWNAHERHTKFNSNCHAFHVISNAIEHQPREYLIIYSVACRNCLIATGLVHYRHQHTFSTPVGRLSLLVFRVFPLITWCAFKVPLCIRNFELCTLTRNTPCRNASWGNLSKWYVCCCAASAHRECFAPCIAVKRFPIRSFLNVCVGFAYSSFSTGGTVSTSSIGTCTSKISENFAMMCGRWSWLWSCGRSNQSSNWTRPRRYFVCIDFYPIREKSLSLSVC